LPKERVSFKKKVRPGPLRNVQNHAQEKKNSSWISLEGGRRGLVKKNEPTECHLDKKKKSSKVRPNGSDDRDREIGKKIQEKGEKSLEGL